MGEPNGNMFKAIDAERRGTSFEEVVTQLREMIHRGELRPGDRLPPERDLAKLLGVSRPTLRAGISSLAAVGVLQPRRGAGTFVVENEGPPALDSNALRLMASLQRFTMAEMSEEITGMFASLDEPEQFLVHDMRFHQTVAAASGNRILTALMNMVATILFEVRSKTVRRARDLKESAEMHRSIYRAIRDRDSEAARDAMRDHLMLAQKAQEQEEAA